MIYQNICNGTLQSVVVQFGMDGAESKSWIGMIYPEDKVKPIDTASSAACRFGLYNACCQSIQHFLNFLPLPQGQGSLRPILGPKTSGVLSGTIS